MCEPTSIALGLSAVAGVVGQAKQAKAQGKANELATKSALQTWVQDQSELSQQQSQEAASTQQQQVGFDLEAAQAMANAQVAMGESGVGGAVADRNLQDIAMQQRDRTTALQQNLSFTEANIASQRRASSQRYIGAQSNQPVVQRPNFISAGLQIASAGIEGYGEKKDK